MKNEDRYNTDVIIRSTKMIEANYESASMGSRAVATPNPAHLHFTVSTNSPEGVVVKINSHSEATRLSNLSHNRALLPLKTST